MKTEMHFQENGKTFGLGFGESGGDFGLSFGELVQVHGTDDYEQLVNKPSIEGVPLVGDKSFPQLNLRGLSNGEIEDLLTL